MQLTVADKLLLIRALDSHESRMLERADRMQQAGIQDAADRHFNEAEDACALRMCISEATPSGPEAHAALEKYLGPLKKG